MFRRHTRNIDAVDLNPVIQPNAARLRKGEAAHKQVQHRQDLAQHSGHRRRGSRGCGPQIPLCAASDEYTRQAGRTDVLQCIQAKYNVQGRDVGAEDDDNRHDDVERQLRSQSCQFPEMFLNQTVTHLQEDKQHHDVSWRARVAEGALRIEPAATHATQAALVAYTAA